VEIRGAHLERVTTAEIRSNFLILRVILGITMINGVTRQVKSVLKVLVKLCDLQRFGLARL